MIFKEGKQFDFWQCSTMALAHAQDVAEVLDPGHVPVTQDDKDLFQGKQKFMFAVFDWMLLTDTGKALVHEHENDFNTQKVYAEVVDKKLTETTIQMTSLCLH